MEYLCVYLPYFAFAAVVIGGMHYRYPWVIVFGLVFFFAYSTEKELKILAHRNVNQYCNCEFNVIKGEKDE